MSGTFLHVVQQQRMRAKIKFNVHKLKYIYFYTYFCVELGINNWLGGKDQRKTTGVRNISGTALAL